MQCVRISYLEEVKLAVSKQDAKQLQFYPTILRDSHRTMNNIIRDLLNMLSGRYMPSHQVLCKRYHQGFPAKCVDDEVH